VGYNSGNTVKTEFDNFMLDSTPAVLWATRSGTDIVLSWPAIPGVVLQSTVSLSPANWQPVPGTATVTGGISSLTVPMSEATSFFRLVH